MDTIVSFGSFLWCYWFKRDDGAWMFRFCLPPLVSVIFYKGLDLEDVAPRRIEGYYFDDRVNNAFGLILHEEGRPYEERHFLAYAEPSERFNRWLEHIAEWGNG